MHSLEARLHSLGARLHSFGARLHSFGEGLHSLRPRLLSLALFGATNALTCLEATIALWGHDCSHLLGRQQIKQAKPALHSRFA